MFIIIIFLYLVTMFFETLPLFKEKNRKKIMLYLFLSTFSMIISTLLTLGVQLPSPSNLIKNIVISIFGKGD